jgi:prevent-host-death family protein
LTRKLTVRELSRNLSEVMGRIAYGGERYVITKNGKHYVALISFDEFRKLEELEDLADNLLADEILKEIEDKGTVSLDEVKKLLE